jgi:hypothetical protein
MPYNLADKIEFFSLISYSLLQENERKAMRKIRSSSINCISSGSSLIKLAFDTRRIDQEIEFNPRRNLQNYNRSEQFISEGMSQKISNFKKLKEILDQIKQAYDKQPEWQDSYIRVLSSSVDKSLRIGLDDGDYGERGNTMASFDYIEELLFARYRIDMNNFSKYGKEDIRAIILSKDDEMVRKNTLPACEISKRDAATKNYDDLLEKLFGNVKATAENPNVERTVTITIRDTFLPEKSKDKERE